MFSAVVSMLAFIQAFFTLLKAFLREIHTCLWKRHSSVGPLFTLLLLLR